VLFDARAGRSPNDANAILSADGIDPAGIRHLFLTHCHADHSGEARGLRDQLGLAVYAGRVTTPMVVAGDEAAISLERARRAGVYPHDYRYRACPVDHVLGDDAATTIGRLKIRTIETPGHSADHVSFLVERGGVACSSPAMPSSTAGKVALQDIPDCSITDIWTTVRKLAAIEFDALLPGHLNFSLRNAHCHAETALAYVEKLRCPPSMI
jgi:hydroxyacylglutathione hydrolase